MKTWTAKCSYQVLWCNWSSQPYTKVLMCWLRCRCGSLQVFLKEQKVREWKILWYICFVITFPWGAGWSLTQTTPRKIPRNRYSLLLVMLFSHQAFDLVGSLRHLWTAWNHQTQGKINRLSAVLKVFRWDTEKTLDMIFFLYISQLQSQLHNVLNIVFIPS